MNELLKCIKDDNVRQVITVLMEAIEPLKKQLQLQDNVMDVDGVATYLNVKKSWVYKRIQYGEIPCTHMGKYPRFRRSEIDTWFNCGCSGNYPKSNNLGMK
ncbi:MAG: helix-turn-helix domain-containing protein [Oryzomonas sp.]|uniref:helix-turn-helix transcriptional regulator n=1 Tax=Oryzomonas sp. TaxID=2855186 RepID=UPI00283CAAC2|nr:helix-turn-helix domain-containing protein [Oryzomonas sp.]MDR3581641.1 helix-turn-helix domain-containing protein [Oryzomonas sp.]